MSTDLETLARRAVACKHFRWMPGMRTDEGWRVIRGSKDSRCWAYDENPENWEIADNRLEDYNLPDLSDPATLGCLLALVREAWGGGVIVCPQHFAGKWVIDLPNGEVASAHTEAEALVAALEAAP